MPLLTQFALFFISPFGEVSVCDALNHFMRAHRIVNIEKRLIDSERGTGWLFLIEFGADSLLEQSCWLLQDIFVHCKLEPTRRNRHLKAGDGHIIHCFELRELSQALIER